MRGNFGRGALENGGNRAKTEACFYDINVTKAGFFAAVGQLKYNRGRRGGGGERRGLIRRRNTARDKTGVNLCWRGKHRVNVDKRLNCAFLRIKLRKTLKKFCDASHGFSIRFDKKEPRFLGGNVFSKAVLTNLGGWGYHIDKDTENVSKNVTRIGGIVYVWRKKFALAKKIRFSQNRVQCVWKSLCIKDKGGLYGRNQKKMDDGTTCSGIGGLSFGAVLVCFADEKHKRGRRFRCGNDDGATGGGRKPKRRSFAAGH